MNPSDAVDRILASLHRAALDDAHWPTTTALIEAGRQRLRFFVRTQGGRT